MRENDGGDERKRGKEGKIAAVAEANPLKQGLKQMIPILTRSDAESCRG